MQPFSPVFHNCLTPLVDSLGTLKISPEQCRGALVSVPVGTYLVVGGRLATRPQVFNSYGTLQHRETGYAPQIHKNMPDSEILKTFDEKRGELKPYGLTCETWRPQLMPKIDRHNEIELNYIPEGSITYFFPTEKVTVPPRKMALFWGLIPHKIIRSEADAPYFVVTIPFNLFLSWRLPSVLVDRILKGEVVVEAVESECGLGKPMFERWVSGELYCPQL